MELTENELKEKINYINDLNYFPLTCSQEKELKNKGSFTSNETPEQKMEDLIMHVLRYKRVEAGDFAGDYIEDKEFTKRFILTHGFILKEFINY